MGNRSFSFNSLNRSKSTYAWAASISTQDFFWLWHLLVQGCWLRFLLFFYYLPFAPSHIRWIFFLVQVLLENPLDFSTFCLFGVSFFFSLLPVISKSLALTSFGYRSFRLDRFLVHQIDTSVYNEKCYKNSNCTRNFQNYLKT